MFPGIIVQVIGLFQFVMAYLRSLFENGVKLGNPLIEFTGRISPSNENRITEDVSAAHFKNGIMAGLISASFIVGLK